MSDNDIDKFSAIHWGQGTAALMGAAEGAKIFPGAACLLRRKVFPKGQEPRLCAYGSLFRGPGREIPWNTIILFFKEEEECLK